MKLISVETTQKLGRLVLKAKKESPHFFFAAGLVGSVASTVLACRATTKLEPVVDEIRNDISTVKQLKQTGGNRPNGDEYTEKDYVRDLTYVYLKSAKSLVKLYGPSVALGAASVGALSGSHVQMTRRNSALTATVATLAKTYDEYRERVREELGAEKELELHRALSQQEETLDGKKQVVTIAGGRTLSMYARVFDETATNFQKDPELNRTFLMHQENWANHLLNSRGHVFLNEVYDTLGMDRTPEGQVVGWVLNGEGDNYIDFGIYEAYNAPFLNGDERAVWLDFNVDGVVFDKI